MRILIIGASGMVGHRLWLNLGAEHEVWGTFRSTEAVAGRSEFNLERARWPVDVLSESDVEKAFEPNARVDQGTRQPNPRPEIGLTEQIGTWTDG